MQKAGRAWDRRATVGVFAPLAVAFLSIAASYAGAPPSGSFDVAWTASATSALVGMLAARAEARPGNRARYTLWALAAGSWLLGQLAWDVFGLFGYPQSPNIADVGWWGFAVLVTASVLALPRGSRSLKAVAALETAPLVVAAVALCIAELWSTAAHSHLGLAPKLSALAYPALYVTAAVLTLHAMLGGRLRGFRARSMRLVLAGIALQAFAFILWSGQLLRQTYVPGTTILDPLWVVGLGAIGIGGLLAARVPEEVAEAEGPSNSGAILPAGMFIALVAAAIAAQFTGAPADASTALRLGILCCGIALIARSMLLGRRLQLLLDRERSAMAALAQREGELARLNDQLLEDSRRDPLTGIGNRRALSDDSPMYESLRRELGEQLAVAVCDVDHFKAYNDRLGHLAGDQALRMIAAIARGTLRPADAAYRFGGEELLLVLRGAGPDEALAVAERVRAAVEHAALPHPLGEKGLLTVSIGVAGGDGTLEELLACADAALYDAKRGGRNRVVAGNGRSALPAPARRRDESDGPMPRHLRSLLSVSRAVASGRGALPVLEALAEVIRAELSFQVVVVNLLEPDRDELRVVAVIGSEEARRKLLDSSSPLAEWQQVLANGEDRQGAAWLPAGSYDWVSSAPSWVPPEVPALLADAWHPEDMLLLPLRNSRGELLGVLSLDQPLLGQRPTDAELAVLMAAADHTALALESLEREAGAAAEQPDELKLAAVMLLAETLDLRDASTAQHSRTVGRLARGTAIELGLDEPRVERIHAAGVLHDLGKLGIADAILQKPGPLDADEWREMRRHPEVGARILEHAGMHDIAAWVRAHHERIDGRGYPNGVRGGRIPLEARILAVADSYEAMVADRPYRAGMDPDSARAELLSCAGTQFDAVVVEAFLRALADPAAAPDGEGVLEPDSTVRPAADSAWQPAAAA